MTETEIVETLIEADRRNMRAIFNSSVIDGVLGDRVVALCARTYLRARDLGDKGLIERALQNLELSARVLRN